MYTMRDVIPLLGLPAPPQNRTDYNVPCPCCDSGRNKHLNVHLVKNVFRCPRCDFSGGVFDLYAHMTGTDRQKVRDELKMRLGKPPGNVTPPVSKPKPAILGTAGADEYAPTDIDARDQTYRELLSMLPLSRDHQKNLLGRGLSAEAIRRYGYRTIPPIGHNILAQKLLAKGCYLAGVPGFHRDKNGDWILVESRCGIMIPVRDPQGRIQGIKIRLDNEKRRKFRWLASRAFKDGCGSYGWIHHAGPVREEIILVEGPMKADIVHYLTGQSVVAVPGVNSLAMLKDTLCELKTMGVRKIMTGFDMDYLNRWPVQKGYWKLVCLLDELGFKFGTYLWHPEYNGLDDFIWQYQMQGRGAV